MPMRGRGRGDFGGDDRPLREPTNTVWVGNLDPATHTDEMLREMFSEFGVVMRVAKHAEQSYAFIHFRHVMEASNAVAALRDRRSLGLARFNYGKMFEYSSEEMQPDYRPAYRPREEGEYGDGYARPARRFRSDAMEPTNVLWVGSLPDYVSEERLREHFGVCGTVKMISRMERGNMAFIHFETVGDCTLALETLQGKPVDGSVQVILNYGHPQRSRPDMGGGGRFDGGYDSGSSTTPAGIHPNEVATNVVYLGQLPQDTTEEDIDAVFDPHEGYINSKFVSSSAIAFGHFTTTETATAARVALQNTTIRGVPIRVSFGKNRHNYSLADKTSAGGPSMDLDELMQDPSSATASGALTTVQVGHSNLVLPAMSGASAGADGSSSPFPADFTQRTTPELNLRARLQSVLGSTYNGCGALGLELSPTQVQAICFMVDQCICEERAQELGTTLALYIPAKAAHVFNIITKRLRDYYTTDVVRKLHIFYAVTKAVLSVPTVTAQFNFASLNAYLMLLLVTTEGQPRTGADHLSTIMDSLEHHKFLEARSNVSPEYRIEFRAQLKEIKASTQAEQDLSSFLSRRRRNHGSSA